MLRILSYNHVFTYVFLFLVTLGLRAPSFHPHFFADDEAYYLTAGERMVDGGAQYLDTWDNKPPVIGWFYAFWVWILGPYAIWGIRIFTILYLFLGALILNIFTIDNRLLSQFSFLPAFFFIIICSVPWYALELNAELLLSVPAIIAFVLLIRTVDHPGENNKTLFKVGLLLGLCFMIKYQALFLFMGLGVAYLVTFPPRLSELFSLFSGFFLLIFIILIFLYFSGSWAAFWDIGVLYNLDYIFVGKNPGERINAWGNLIQYIKIWGALLSFSLIGMAFFRFNYFKNAIRLRKVEQMVLLWFIGALAGILIGGGRFYLHYFYLVAPPLAIYSAKFFELPMRFGWMRSVFLSLGLAWPIFTFLTFAYVSMPTSFGFLKPYFKPGGWVDVELRAQIEPHPLEGQINSSKVRNGILVMDYEPVIYQKLGLPCASKYTNFSIAFFKWELLGNPETPNLVSASESTASVLLSLKSEMPDCFIDKFELFPKLRDAIPMLFDNYKVKSVQARDLTYKIYCRD